MPQNEVAVPRFQVRKKHIVALLGSDGRMNTQETFRVWTHINSFREIVRFLFWLLSDQLGMTFHLMQVERKSTCIVKELRQPLQSFVPLRVLSSHDS